MAYSLKPASPLPAAELRNSRVPAVSETAPRVESPARPVRLLISTVIVVCELSAAMADEKKPEPSTFRIELREALRSEFHFGPRPLPELASPPAWSTHLTLADMPPPVSGAIAVDPEVVRMKPVIVHGDAVFRAIDSALEKQTAQAKERKMYSRLGVGVHEVRLGKLHLGVLTELGVPVMISIAW